MSVRLFVLCSEGIYPVAKLYVPLNSLTLALQD